MKRILLLPNPTKDPGYAVSRKIIGILSAKGAEVYLSSSQYSELLPTVAKDIACLSGEPDLVIAVGGDGTVLSAAQDAIRYGLPLLGVNLGRLGFLAELEVDSLGRLEQLFTHDYRIDGRMTLQVESEIEGEKKVFPVTPLNDVTFGHEFGAGLVELSLSDDDGNHMDYRADGLILSTPSGSTAYSLSAGGPIIDDTVEAICVTPVCPHSFFNRSIIFGRDTHLTIENCSLHGEEVIVSLDGTEALRLPKGGRVTVSRSSRPLRMLSLDRRATLRSLNSKMQMAEMKYRK